MPRKPKKFPGMKEQPVFGRKKAPEITYKDLVPFDGLPKPNMNKRDLKTFNKFIQVKEGETREQWVNRTAHRRILTEEDKKLLRKSHPMIIRETRHKKKEKETNFNKFKIYQTARDFDFLKFYSVVLNYYSIKYGIYKEWLEVGFYFYDGIPFSRVRFENACVLSFCSSKNVFNHFKKKGWIIPLTKKTKNRRDNVVEHKTELFTLHNKFICKLTYIYDVLVKLRPLKMQIPMSSKMQDEAKKIIMELNDEVMEIKMGKKPEEDILN